MGWDNISDGDNRGFPAQVSGDATLRFDQMLMTDSFLLDEHSYDNYLDELDEQDVSFAVPPFASSTPTTQKKNSRQLEASKSRLVQLRGPATPALPAQGFL
jgi:3-phenylpropionate/cinnamic acid dioxygenase small subunit